MENVTEQKPKKDRKTLWFGILAFVIFATACATFALVVLDARKDARESNEKLLKEQGLNSICSYKRDSLLNEVIQLSIYKTLTQAMVNRDKVTSQLKYKVGEMVYMKNDSSRVVVEDIVVGGSKYNYYVKYKVLYKDNTSKEVVPELIY